MRRSLSLAFTVAFLAVTGATTGVAHAAPGPKAAVKIAAGAACKPVSMYCFKKSAKTVASGTRVTWKNTTIAPHNVTRCTPAACSGNSGGTGTDAGFGGAVSAKYKFVFQGAGTYNYYCTVHGYGVMHGTVTVT